MALHPEISLAMAQPLAHHMTPYFRNLYRETLERLGRIFKTGNYMLMMPCSGTGILEAAVQNLFSPGESLILTNGGAYGARFKATCRRFGVDAININLECGEPASPGLIAQALKDHPEARSVVVIHVETSTGVISPLKEIAEVVKSADREVLLLVDAVASMGGANIRSDEWGLDVVVSASQKALMGPPGLGLASISELGWKRAAESCCPRYYFDFAFSREEFASNRYPVTPPVTVIYGLHKALQIIERQSLESVQANCLACRDYLLQELPKLGYRHMARKGYEAPTLTAAYTPQGKSALAIMDRLYNEYNITVCTGIGENLDTVLRIGHRGYTGVEDLARLLAALKKM